MYSILLMPTVLIVLGLVHRFTNLKKGSIWGFKSKLALEDDYNWRVTQKIFALNCLIFGVASLAYILIIELLVNNAVINDSIAGILRLLSLIFLVILYIRTDKQSKEYISNNKNQSL